MALYRLAEDGYIVRTTDNALIPPDPRNSDYQSFLAWSQANTPDPIPKQDLGAVAAEARYLAEVSGILLGGAPILTDRESQGLINGAVALAQINPAILIRFKTATNDFVTLDAQAIFAIGVAVGTHVQNCFARESQVATEIQTNVLATEAQVRARFADLMTPSIGGTP